MDIQETFDAINSLESIRLQGCTEYNLEELYDCGGTDVTRRIT